MSGLLRVAKYISKFRKIKDKKKESTCRLGSKTKRYFHASIDGQTDKQNVVYTYIGTSLSLRKGSLRHVKARISLEDVMLGESRQSQRDGYLTSAQ